MAKAPSAVVCSFTHEQLVDLIAEIDRRTRPAPAAAPAAVPLSAVEEFAAHRRGCDGCTRGGSNRCEIGQPAYANACAALLDQARILL